MTMEEKLELFQEQVSCGKNVYTWYYDGQRRLVGSNCPYEDTMDIAFDLFGCKDALYRHVQEDSRPILLGAPIGLMWVACSQTRDGGLERVVVLGPVFTSDVSLSGIKRMVHELGVSSHLEVSMAWRYELANLLEYVPTLSFILVNQYALMLHYTLTGEKLMFSDIMSHTEGFSAESAPAQEKDRHKVWLAEQGLMRMVREGDLNYKLAFSTSGSLSSGVPTQSADPLRQAKTSMVAFATLCSRAAIEGGLSPEQAYSLGDRYIQAAESAKTISEIAAISPTMYEDFIRRVHDQRTDPNLSKQIRACCDYIELNVEEDFTISDLAERIGYSEYYLSRKFKNETGVSLNSYINIARVERAKLLLTITDEGIQEIADRLHFCSRSYFSEAFRKITGITPAKFRQEQAGG